jgi:hypothetical protein
MSPKHWLAAYGEKIPCEINPDVHGSVLELFEGAMRRDAALCRQICVSLLRPNADLCRHRSTVARLRRLPAGQARREEGRSRR